MRTSVRWGRQLDRVSRELMARAWQAGAGPGDGPLTIDLDSTICGPTDWRKEGTRAGTGDVLNRPVLPPSVAQNKGTPFGSCCWSGDYVGRALGPPLSV